MDNEVMQIGPLQLIGVTFDYLIYRKLLSLLRQVGNTSLHKLFSQYGCIHFKRNIIHIMYLYILYYFITVSLYYDKCLAYLCRL